MIATLSGRVAEKFSDTVVLDVGGVGYGIAVTAEEYPLLAVGESAKLYVYEYIREASHELFGFLQLNTKQLFEQLLVVNGVGPRMAMNVLNIGTPNEVRRAIASGDIKALQQASGVGKRLAERIVVELKDKVGLLSTDLDMAGFFQSTTSLLHDEAVEALVVLGFTPQDARVALQKVDPSLSTEQRVKSALQGT